MKLLLLAALLLPCLVFAQTSVPKSPPSPSPLIGSWFGPLEGTPLTVQLNLSQDAAGRWLCTLDSPVQHAAGIPCELTSATNPIAFKAPTLNASWSGSLSTDNNTLTGTLTQGAPMPLTLKRQAKPVAVEAPPALMPALPPADAKTIKAILDKDLAESLATGALAPATHAGVTIGVISHGERAVFSYGTAKPDSVFEIGSISKTFTATILAQMVQQKLVTLDEPVRELLPPGTVTKPASGGELRLIDLSDQHSGLPRMPTNFAPKDPANPYADYDAKLLYAFLQQQGVARDPAATFVYSNLGVGLLGQALANRAKSTYPELLHAQVTGPLGMSDTAVALTPAMQARFIQGYDGRHNPAHAWDLDALAGAGGIRSTAADMLTYLAAQLHPDKLPASVATSPDGKTLGAAISATHEIHGEVSPGVHIALNWFHIDESGSFWHNGGTGGYSSYALFNPARDYAVVVLSNTAPGGSDFADTLGQHIAQRLAGVPAMPFTP